MNCYSCLFTMDIEEENCVIFEGVRRFVCNECYPHYSDIAEMNLKDISDMLGAAHISYMQNEDYHKADLVARLAGRLRHTMQKGAAYTPRAVREMLVGVAQMEAAQ